MAENSTRKTQARIAERERLRRQEERSQTLKTVVPVIVGIIILLAVGYGFITLTNQSSPTNAGVVGPRLQVDREKIDLGKQHLGNTVRAVFTLKNAGDGTLTLNVPRTVTLLQGC